MSFTFDDEIEVNGEIYTKKRIIESAAAQAKRMKFTDEETDYFVLMTLKVFEEMYCK